MDLWEMIGVSRQSALGVLIGGVAAAVLCMALVFWRSRSERRTVVDLKER